MSVFLSYANEGSSFVYGYLVNGKAFNEFDPAVYPNGTAVSDDETYQTAVGVAKIFNDGGFMSGQF